MPFALADWQLGSLTWPVNCLSSKSFVCCRRCRRLQNCESKTNWWKLLAIVARFVLRYIRVLIRNNSKRQTLERKKVLCEPFFSFVLQKRSLNLLMETWKLQLSSGAGAAVLRLLFICNNLACKQPTEASWSQRLLCWSATSSSPFAITQRLTHFESFFSLESESGNIAHMELG